MRMCLILIFFYFASNALEILNIFMYDVSHFRCSPKIENSDTREKREKIPAILFRDRRSYAKFTVCREFIPAAPLRLKLIG